MSRIATASSLTLVMALGITTSAWGAAWTGDIDNDWFKDGNWDTGSIPTAADKAEIGKDDPNAPLVNALGAVTADTEVGRNGVGALNIGPSGGITVEQLSIGATDDGTVNVNGGTVTATAQMLMGDGGNGQHGQLNMTSGSMTVLSALVGLDAGTTAHIQLDGGSLFISSPGSLRVGGATGSGIDGAGTIDLAGGVMSTEGDVTGFFLWTAPVAEGLITGFGKPDPGDGSRVKLVYDDALDTTFMFGVPEPSSIALLALGTLGLVLGWRRRSA